MPQVIEENRKPHIGELFGQAFSNVGQQVGQGIPQMLMGRQAQAQAQNQKNKTAQFVKQVTGYDLTGDENPEFVKELVSKALAGQNQEKEYKLKDINAANQFERDKQLKIEELQGKKREATQPFENALGVLKRMRELGKKGNLGRGSGVKSFFSNTFGSGESARDFGEYEQLGKSLISMASSIPIRNQAEFKVLSDNLFDPSIPDSEREGILDAMERVIRNSLNAVGGEEQPQFTNDYMGAPKNKGERPPLDSFNL